MERDILDKFLGEYANGEFIPRSDMVEILIRKDTGLPAGRYPGRVFLATMTDRWLREVEVDAETLLRLKPGSVGGKVFMTREEVLDFWEFVEGQFNRRGVRKPEYELRSDEEF